MEAGQRLLHYRLIEKIGEGGMGEVYRARDTRLDRDVALKVLPPGVANDATRLDRFRREARAVAGLNHPHIVTLYSVEESGGIHFLTMELVEGHGLEHAVRPSGLHPGRLLRIGIAVADALAAAHAKGIVHRDIKPANVMLTMDDQVKVLDFGLAKLTRTGGSENETTTEAMPLTEASTVVGTVHYMSPEQLRGQSVDPRSDIFSLGVLLYELATGRRPFHGDSQMDVVSAILRDTAVPLRQLNGAVPVGLERIVKRCLQKERDDRYPAVTHLRDELADLERELAGEIPSGAVRAERSPGPTRLAVMPFDNLGGNPAEDVFVDGMHEEVLTTLAGVKALEVISRTSVRYYKDRAVRLSDIARELRVEKVVTGSVRASGSQVRIAVQLIDAAMDRNLWAHSYQRELRDVLTLQAEIARAIASAVQAALTPEEEARLRRSRQIDPVSYDAYLRGRHHWGRRTPEGLNRAGEYFQTAIDADPTYAMAYAGLADCYLMKGAGFYAVEDPHEAYARARACARKAIELDPGMAEPHASLGYLATFFDWNWEAGARHFERAIEINPGYATAHLWSGLRLGVLGRVKKAIAAVDRALELDPLSLIIITDKGFVYMLSGYYDEAIRWADKALELDRGFAVAHWGRGLALEGLVQYDEAEASFRRAIEIAGDNVVYHAALARVLALEGQMEEATRQLGRLLTAPGERSVPFADIALVYVAMGQTDQALDALERAHERRENPMALLNVDTRLDPLRSDPRFQRLLRSMVFPA